LNILNSIAIAIHFSCITI